MPDLHASEPTPTRDGYHRYVAETARLYRDARSLAPVPSPPPSAPSPSAPVALVMAPHPDDECVMGALPLRLARAGYGVVAVAVTLGSREDRRAERVEEMAAACGVLGFGLEVLPSARGGGLRMEERSGDADRWAQRVGEVVALLERHRPRVVFTPHDQDAHGAHLATRELTLEALAAVGRPCRVVETEFWGQMGTPNLLVASSVEEAGDLVAALAHHVGEVARNPYHLRLPAWLMDNVRRGAEALGGHGSSAPALVFGTLYRLGAWRDGALHPASAGRILGLGDDPVTLFEEPRTPEETP